MKIAKRIIMCIIGSVSFFVHAQKTCIIKGSFPDAKNTELALTGFDCFKDISLAQTQCDSTGTFSMSYPANYVGAAILKIKGKSSLIVLLNKESFTLNWGNFKDFGSLKFIGSEENLSFSNGIKIYQEAENILSGLKYLKPLYADSPEELLWINKEIAEQEKALPNFSENLPKDSYAKYYISIRKFVQDLPLTANRYIERLQENEQYFAGIDFSDYRLIQSGLLKELIDGFYLLMESHGNVDDATLHANKATEALLKSLRKNPLIKQEIGEYLFKYLEKRSMFKAAEFLARSMLSDQSCSLNATTSAMYEQYRKMANGQKAPDIIFTSPAAKVKKLTDIKAKFKLVFFGSSWCPKCQEEFTELKQQYQNWKNQYDMEIVFISLDEDPIKYSSLVNDFPWLSSCDFKGWKTKSAVDYNVFATPTMYLLSDNNTILVKPVSAAQISSWLINKGNRN